MTRTPISLLEKLQSVGDQAAWVRFVQIYTPLLTHWAYRLGLAGPEAADLVQDVFTLLVQKLPHFRYDPARRFRGWLWTVTLNCCREKQRRLTVAPAAASDWERQGQETAGDVAEEVAEEEYRQYLTRRALELMQAEFQAATWRAFWECVVEERPAAEVAAELGLSENAVYLAKGRVLRRLREELAGLLD
jgi:RNA polymerase sigma-70 factor (ECF subfamily)